MKKIFTIGFTKKTAEDFFVKLIENKVITVIDIRLNNTSQLAGFSKYPDIQYFLSTICNTKYIHDDLLSPTNTTLTNYKKKNITWEQYEIEFYQTMESRNIDKYITDTYSNMDNFCLLCSEEKPQYCHRRLVAGIFKNVFKDVQIINL